MNINIGAPGAGASRQPNIAEGTNIPWPVTEIPHIHGGLGMSSTIAANSLLPHPPPSASNWPAGAEAAHVGASNTVSQAFESFAKEGAQPPLANKRVRKSTADVFDETNHKRVRRCTADVCNATNQRPASAAGRSNADTAQGSFVEVGPNDTIWSVVGCQLALGSTATAHQILAALVKSNPGAFEPDHTFHESHQRLKPDVTRLSLPSLQQILSIDDAEAGNIVSTIRPGEQNLRRLGPGDQELIFGDDTLELIAKRFDVDCEATLNQKQVAMFNANREAFKNGNMNAPKPIDVIKMPTAEDVLAIDDKAAAGIVANHRKEHALLAGEQATVAREQAVPAKEQAMPAREQAMLASLQKRYDEAMEPIVSSPKKRVYQVHRHVPLPGSRA
jgi:Tfp pilus assembly protein FimV